MSRPLRGLRQAGNAIANDWHHAVGDPQRLATRLWLLLGVVLLAGLWYAPSTTGDALGIRRFRTPEISGTTRIAQQFVMRERLLTGVEVRPAVVGDVSGALRFTLTDMTTDEVIQSVDVDARDVVSRNSFGFWINRIDDSRGRKYELAIASSDEAPARGVAFWATRGDRLDRSTLLINGAERWADLAFRARTPTRSMIDVLWSGDASLRGWLALLGIALSWVLVGALLRAVAGLPVTSTSGDPGR